MMHAYAYGRLISAPTTSISESGRRLVVTASLAVDLATRKDPREAHLLLRAFGQQAETLIRHGPGDMLGVSGRVQRHAWTDDEGEERFDLELVVHQVASLRTVLPGSHKQMQRVPYNFRLN